MLLAQLLGEVETAALYKTFVIENIHWIQKFPMCNLILMIIIVYFSICEKHAHSKIKFAHV